MALASTLDLPALDYQDPTLVGPRFHEVMREARARSWLARTDIGYLVLERETAIEVLRDRRLAFPAVQMLLLQGITDGPIYDRTADGLMRNGATPTSGSGGWCPRACHRVPLPGCERSWAPSWPSAGATSPSGGNASSWSPSPSRSRRRRWPSSWACLGRRSAWPDGRSCSKRSSRSGPGRIAPPSKRRTRRSATTSSCCSRSGGPGPDFLSAIANHHEDGDRLSDDECVTLAIAVISGGVDTTRAQLSHGMRLFAEHPAQWDLLAEHPELAAQAANEVLRFEPITPFTARVAVEDVEYRGVTFPEGSLLFACAETANRDPSAFERPDEFDITVDRGRTPILTFGFGDHFCLGAQLARMELAETFAFLAPRMRGLRLDGDPRYGSIIGIYPMESLPLAFEPP